MTALRLKKAATAVAVFILELPATLLFLLIDGLVWIVKRTPLRSGVAWAAKRFAATSTGKAYLAAQDAFLDVAEGDGVDEMREKAAEKTKLFAWYNALDAVLAGVFAWLILIPTALGVSAGATMAIGIAFDILVPIPFLVLAFKKGQDLTLGTDFRRALDALRKPAPLAWGLALCASIVRGAIWNGPEYVILFFRKEIGESGFRIGAILVFLAVFQALFWGWLWMLGYDSAIEPLWELLVSLTR